MADYRVISQEYAKEAIKAAILINGGACGIVLNQMSNLMAKQLGSEAAVALLLWSFGLVSAFFTWVLAFLSTRYVDKSQDEPDKSSQHTDTSNYLMYGGLGLVTLSILMFLGGCLILSCAVLKTID